MTFLHPSEVQPPFESVAPVLDQAQMADHTSSDLDKHALEDHLTAGAARRKVGEHHNALGGGFCGRSDQHALCQTSWDTTVP